MSTEIYYFTGLIKWAKVHQPDPMYKNYTIDLFMDTESVAAFKKSGIQSKFRETPEDADEPTGSYVRFKRDSVKSIKDKLVEFGPPDVLDSNNNPLSRDTLIGNGSRVTIKVSVYDSRNGKGHRLDAVRVDELVPYEGGPQVQNAEMIEAPF